MLLLSISIGFNTFSWSAIMFHELKKVGHNPLVGSDLQFENHWSKLILDQSHTHMHTQPPL